jgi:hypothetical protein
MHGMAGETGKLTFLKARSFNEAVIFAPGNPNHSVRPKRSMKELWILSDLVGKSRVTGHTTQTDQYWRVIGENHSWPKTEAMRIKFGVIPNIFDPMAGAANLGRPFGIDPGGIDNAEVAFGFLVKGVSAQGVTVFVDMLVGRSVAGFTGNAQFSHPGVENVRPGILERFATGGMTTNAMAIPDLDQPGDIRWFEEHFIPRDPALIFEQEGEWKTELLVAIIARHPVSLHIV